MTIKLMRYVDYWLGVPISFALTSFNFLSKLLSFGKRKKNRPPRKILFIKLAELGTIVLVYPLLRHIRKKYPSAEISFLTFEKNKEIFAVLDNIVKEQNILTIRDTRTPAFLLDTAKVIKKIRKEKIDVVFDLEFFSRFSAILTSLAGADKKIGFYRYAFEGLYRGNLLTHKIQYNPLIHAGKAYFSLLGAVEKEKKSTPELEQIPEGLWNAVPKYVSSPPIKEGIKKRLKKSGINEKNRLFLVNPGEGVLPLREWPLENFVFLCKRLLEDTTNYVVLAGTSKARKKAEALYAAVKNKRCVSLVGKTTLPEVLELLNIADALIANDCGLGHLASLSSVKKFIIFGPESPTVFRPLGENSHTIYSDLPCSPCLSVFNHRNSVCKDNKCLKVIKPGYVYELIRKSL